MKSATVSSGIPRKGRLQPLSWREGMVRLLQGHEDVQFTADSEEVDDTETLVSSEAKDKWTNIHF